MSDERRRPVSIQTQLVLGVGVILLLALLIALTGYISLRLLQSGIQTLQEASQIRESSLQLENDFLLARQAESTYLATWRTSTNQSVLAAYLYTNKQYLAESEAELSRLGSLIGGAHDPELRSAQADIDALGPLLEAYGQAFDATSGRIEVRSLPGGLDAALSGGLEDLEKQFGNAANPRFRELIMQIRASEQAYFNTRRQEYADIVHLRLSDLVSLLNATDRAELNLTEATMSKAVLVSRADLHAAAFDQALQIDQEIDINTAVFRQVTADVDRIAGRIASQSAEGLTRAQARLQTTGRNATLMLAVTAVLALALGAVVALVVGRRIVRPLAQLTRAAERLGGGELDRPVSVAGAAEIATLADTFNTMAGRLRELIGSLEQRVAARTRGLQAAAEVSQATTSVLDPDELLRQVVDLVRDRFALYYVGLFLLNEEGEFAVLRAGTGRAGQQMMGQRHRLKVGSESMIGACIAQNQARVALDVDTELTRFANPLLPDTRSELALPMRSRGRVIGAMTVQSTHSAAFDESDIAVMQTMADQVGVAIDNANLFSATQSALDEMAATQRHYLGQVWREYEAAAGPTRYEVGQRGPVTVQAMQSEIGQAIGQREATAVAGPGYSALVVPIVMRGQVIGVLRVQDASPGRAWSEEEIATAEALGERLALAADNLRLLEESQGRAARERLTREITARLRETLDVDVVLDTAVEDIVRALDLEALDLRLGTDGQGKA